MVYWDIKDSLGNYYEVKLDEKALYYARKQNRPPNMFMEYWSTKRNEACGVMVLEVNYFVYIVKQLDKCFMAYVFDYETMKEHLIKTEYKSRDNSATGDNNALGWLVPIHEITNSPDSGYLKSVIL